MVNIVKMNPCHPFLNMAREADFEEMLVDSLARAFGLTTLGRLHVDEAVHHAFKKKAETGEVVIMRDIVEEVWNLRERFGEALAFEICALFNCMIDDAYPEYELFCDRDGLPVNALDIDQLKALYRNTSNRGARAFVENMILYALMF